MKKRVGIIVGLLVAMVIAGGLGVGFGAYQQHHRATVRQEQKVKAAQKAAAVRKAKRIKAQRAAALDKKRRAADSVYGTYAKNGLTYAAKKQDEQKKVTFIGDSVMLGSKPRLQKLFPKAVVDAAVSRQVWDATDLIAKHKADGTLADTVVIGLGTNCTFSTTMLAKVMTSLGSRQVYWINVHVPNDWQDDLNDMLSKATRKYDNLTIIDWQGLCQDSPQWFGPDKTHPNTVGQPYYAALVAQRVGQNKNQ